MSEEQLPVSSHRHEAGVETSVLIENYMGVRDWQDANMPIYGSFIGFDLILFLSRSRYQPSPYSLKDIFHSLKYSEGALRIFIRRLEKDGWISLETWPGDRRNKKIIVHDSLFIVVENFLQHVQNRTLLTVAQE